MSPRRITTSELDFRDKFLEERLLQSLHSIIPLLKKLSTRNLTICDLGCGDLKLTKLFSLKLRNHGFNISLFYGIDINDTSWSTNNKKEFTLIKWDLNQKGIPIPAGSVDLAFSLETIEHLYNTDCFIEEIYRILKKEGLLLISTPNLLAWYNRILFPLGILPIHYSISSKKIYGRKIKLLGQGNKSVGHIRIFTPHSLAELLQDYGFEVLSIKGLQFIFEGPISIFDKFFAKFSSLSSNFLIIARKV